MGCFNGTAYREIRALAQYPWFDPRDCQKYFNDENLIEHTKVKAIIDPLNLVQR